MDTIIQKIFRAHENIFGSFQKIDLSLQRWKIIPKILRIPKTLIDVCLCLENFSKITKTRPTQMRKMNAFSINVCFISYFAIQSF
jgi:hypothetical protein